MAKLFKLPVVAVLLVALLGGGVFTYLKMTATHAPVLKHPGPTVPLDKPFMLNLADPGGTAYANISIGVQLEDMSEEDFHVFEAGGLNVGGGHGGGDVVTGPMRVASDQHLRDAAVRTITRFTAAELLRPEGKDKLERALLQSFERVADGLAPPKPAKGHKAPPHDASQPPYHIADIFFSEFAISPAS